MQCPHCKKDLTPDQIRSLWGQLTASLRRKHGAGAGRPKKFRTCKKCGRRMGTAEMRRHKC